MKRRCPILTLAISCAAKRRWSVPHARPLAAAKSARLTNPTGASTRLRLA